MRVLLLLAVLAVSGIAGLASPGAVAGEDARASTAPAASLWPSFPFRPTPASLDEETLAQLTIILLAPGSGRDSFPVDSFVSSFGMQPGQTTAPTLGIFECCHFFTPVDARVRWSITPPDGASVDPASGLLTIDPATPGGSVFTLRADVENGRRIIEVQIHVFTPESNPLVGYRTEVEQHACGTGAAIAPAEPIEELVINADGTFTVTWFPFETYKDYWGTYAFDQERGTLEMTIEFGNYVPDDVDGSGRFSFDERGFLVLTDIWLGTGPQATGERACGHVFG